MPPAFSLRPTVPLRKPAGARLDMVLEKRSGRVVGGPLLLKTALQRLHGKRSVLDLRYRWQLLTGGA